MHPTRGLDVGAVNFIHNKFLEICKKGIPIILVSTELEEIMSLSDRIVVIPNGAPRRSVIESYIESDKLELVYVGSLAKWHSPGLVRDVCRSLENIILDSLLFL